MDAGLLDGILLLSRSTDTELHFWAAALLLNLLTSDHAKRQMVRDDIIHALMGLVARNDRKEVENMATKTLVVLSMFNDSVARRVQAICFAPLLRYLTDIAEEAIGGHAPLFARMGQLIICLPGPPLLPTELNRGPWWGVPFHRPSCNGVCGTTTSAFSSRRQATSTVYADVHTPMLIYDVVAFNINM